MRELDATDILQSYEVVSRLQRADGSLLTHSCKLAAMSLNSRVEGCYSRFGLRYDFLADPDTEPTQLRREPDKKAVEQALRLNEQVIPLTDYQHEVSP